jgi:mono/diheme cytochrome c family protein
MNMSTESEGTELASNEPAPSKSKRGRMLGRIVIVVVGILIAIQLVPYGRSHANPSITHTVQWDQPATEALVRRACFDCHSNETHWPWYSNVAPASWLVQHDVDEGRGELNFSEGKLGEIDEAGELIQSGEMPPWFYCILHSPSRLTASEQTQLMQGLTNTFGLGHDAEDESD